NNEQTARWFVFSSARLDELAARDERALAHFLAPADFTDEHLRDRVQHDDLPRIKLLGMRYSDAAARKIARNDLALKGLSLGPERRRINGGLERAGAGLALEPAEVFGVLL